ncbi:hypothetical protein C4D60_Mb04t31110 [Musa balbisiana]|uniref:Uncharacterized protein n=1 Tax=Musa balbisiana TaxID=52838 RepID=A0A4S8KG44_MUSBA|nr:hypothetical protein C4D60_Mb04t31110 [Musa balbisiana]
MTDEILRRKTQRRRRRRRKKKRRRRRARTRKRRRKRPPPQTHGYRHRPWISCSIPTRSSTNPTTGSNPSSLSRSDSAKIITKNHGIGVHTGQVRKDTDLKNFARIRDCKRHLLGRGPSGKASSPRPEEPTEPREDSSTSSSSVTPAPKHRNPWPLFQLRGLIAVSSSRSGVGACGRRSVARGRRATLQSAVRSPR